MAAPNLVNVSSIYGKTVGASLGTSIAAVLANGGSSNKVLKINSIYVTNVDGTNNPGDEYSTNVTVSGTEVTIVIPSSGVSNLYYYCSIHSGMGGRIIIKDQTSGSGGGSGY